MNKLLYYKKEIADYNNQIESLIIKRANLFLMIDKANNIISFIEQLLVDICSIPLEFDLNYNYDSGDIRYLTFNISGDIDLIFDKVKDLYPFANLLNYNRWGYYICVEL